MFCILCFRKYMNVWISFSDTNSYRNITVVNAFLTMISLRVHSYEKQIFDMVKPSPKAAPAARGRAMKPASPKKTKHAPSMRNNLNKKKQKPVPLICVLGFQDPFYIKVYKYTLSKNKPGFINPFKKWSKGEVVCDELMEANFIGL